MGQRKSQILPNKLKCTSENRLLLLLSSPQIEATIPKISAMPWMIVHVWFEICVSETVQVRSPLDSKVKYRPINTYIHIHFINFEISFYNILDCKIVRFWRTGDNDEQSPNDCFRIQPQVLFALTRCGSFTLSVAPRKSNSTKLTADKMALSFPSFASHCTKEHKSAPAEFEIKLVSIDDGRSMKNVKATSQSPCWRVDAWQIIPITVPISRLMPIGLPFHPWVGNERNYPKQCLKFKGM